MRNKIIFIMNLSYNWLKDYLKFDLSPEETSKALTSLGLEVGSVKEIESIKGGLKGLVVGKVLSCEVHENSDHLHVTTVDMGEESPSQIVCGAPNVAANQKVIVATLNTTLYNGDEEFTIKKTKIRGVESFGMICSAAEIGVGNSHDGIIELPADTPVGMLAADYYNIKSDYLIEVDITPNRVEAASHYGVARDLAAYLKQNNIAHQLIKPPVDRFKAQASDKAIKVTVEDLDKCPRYTGVTISGVKVAESPAWLKEKLTTIGLRPINNAVDVTNFVLHELGHPLHAFDADKIKGNEVVVKTLPEGSKFITLDGVERNLSAQDLMICNKEAGMCLAGIFGGLESGVTENTTNIFLEVAYFQPMSVRKSARRHSLSTDSSFRFERGTDPNDCLEVIKRATLLILELCGGEIIGEIQDVYPTSIQNHSVELTYNKVNTLIGKEIPKETIKSILTSLEIAIVSESDSTLSLSIPTYRIDVVRDVDVIEEILRVYGYNNIETQSSVKSNLSYLTETDRSYELQNIIAQSLSGAGFNEILNNSLTHEAYYDNLQSYPKEHCVKLINALSSDLNVMRQTLLFGGLESIAYNVNRKIADIKFYEFGNCYYYNAPKSSENNILAPYREDFKLSLWICGNQNINSWNYKTQKTSFYDLKSYVENILIKLGLRNKYSFETAENDLYSNALNIKVHNKVIGTLGIVNSKIRKSLDINQDIYFAELSWTALANARKTSKTTFSEISKYPIVERDFALLVDLAVQFADIEKVASKADKKLLKSINLFDVYEGKNLPEGKKSYAVKFNIQDENKTLNDKQIDTLMQKIQSLLEKELGAQLR